MRALPIASNARFRAAAFVVLAAWILLSPAYRQILGRRSDVVRPWVMFSLRGTTLVVPRFVLHGPAGEQVVVDRYAALGFDGPRRAPAWLWRIRGRGGLDRVTRALCETMGPSADLRVSARMATTDGWRQLRLPAGNACPTGGERP